MKATLLGCDKRFEAREEGGKLMIDFGFVSPEEMASKHVYTVKVTQG